MIIWSVHRYAILSETKSANSHTTVQLNYAISTFINLQWWLTENVYTCLLFGFYKFNFGHFEQVISKHRACLAASLDKDCRQDASLISGGYGCHHKCLGHLFFIIAFQRLLKLW